MERLIDNIYRICVPFDNIYTSVFVIKCGEKNIVFDCATTEDDVKDYIYPELKNADIVPDLIVISHSHSDHSGGLKTLCAYYPNAEVAMFSEQLKAETPNSRLLKDGEELYGVLKFLNLKGHSEDSLAVLDKRSNTVLTFDCVQLEGVGCYRSGIGNAEEYEKSLERIKNTGVENLIASHEYDPLGSTAYGRNAVEEYLDYYKK